MDFISEIDTSFDTGRAACVSAVVELAIVLRRESLFKTAIVSAVVLGVKLAMSVSLLEICVCTQPSN